MPIYYEPESMKGIQIMKFQLWLIRKQKFILLITTLLIAIALIAKYSFKMALSYNLAMAVAAIIAIVPIAIDAYQSLRFKIISIELLVTIAVVGAFIIGEYDEAAIVTFLFLFGNFLEQKTIMKTRQSILDLNKIVPKTALVYQKDGSTKETKIEQIKQNDVLLIKSGDALPVDGQVVAGQGYLNEAAITGESDAVAKKTNDQVTSGTTLTDGFLQVKATKVGPQTTFAKILDLVEDAEDTKSHTEKFIDHFAKYYTPAVLVIAIITWIITANFRLAITLLVLSCPGALVIGVPVSNAAGIGNGAKHGVLIKGGEAMNTFAKVDTIAFDKTGTLTTGNPTVVTTKIYTKQVEAALAKAACIESATNHPLAHAITKYVSQKQIDYQNLSLTNLKVERGAGVSAQVDNTHVLIGNEVLIKNHRIKLTVNQKKTIATMQTNGSTVIILAIDQQLAMILGVSDQIRPEVPAQLKWLQEQAHLKLIMLTGDNSANAQIIAQQASIADVRANLLPAQKAEIIKNLQKNGYKVAFVGDGINDSPSIASADIGMAMGNSTDIAMKTSDIVLLQNDFRKLTYAYRLAKKVIANNYENIIIAIGTVVFLLIGLIFGFIYMASGMLVHEFSILVVIFNAMRLNYFGKN